MCGKRAIQSLIFFDSYLSPFQSCTEPRNPFRLFALLPQSNPIISFILLFFSVLQLILEVSWLFWAAV